MIRRSASAAVVALTTLLVETSSAFAAAADPTKIGDNTRSLVEPNAKSFWIVFLIFGVLFMACTRKGSRAATMGVTLLVSGIAIWNPAGVMSMMEGVANKIVTITVFLP